MLHQLRLKWTWNLLKSMPIHPFISKLNAILLVGNDVFLHSLLLLDSMFLLIYLIPFRRNQELIEQLSTPPPGSKDLYFPTEFSQPFSTQCKACFWKQNWSYWRNPQYNAVRFFMTIVIGALFGAIFWDKGDQT